MRTVTVRSTMKLMNTRADVGNDIFLNSDYDGVIRAYKMVGDGKCFYIGSTAWTGQTFGEALEEIKANVFDKLSFQSTIQKDSR